MFSDDACGYPCPRFVKGGTDPQTDMVQCAVCLMWFVDEDPIDPDDPDA
jgi:hypothetical protein